MKHRELAYCGIFGASALLLPVLFHLIHLGHIFMPMYLPLVTLAFFVRPGPSSLTALVVPLLSGAATGMPPFYPPVAPVMALELALMTGLIGTVRLLFPRVKTLMLLIPVLAIGRVAGAALYFLLAGAMGLPAKFVAGISLLSGWPGLVIMIIAIPTIVKLSRISGGTNERVHPNENQACL